MHKYRIVKVTNGMYKIQFTRTDIGADDRVYYYEMHGTAFETFEKAQAAIARYKLEEANNYTWWSYTVVGE